MRSNDKIEEEFHLCMKSAVEPSREQWSKSAENHKFVRGRPEDQWQRDDLRDREETSRPSLAISDVTLAVGVVSGKEVTSRDVATFQPRGVEDRGWISTLREVDRYNLEATDAAVRESDAFRDLIIGGLSCVDISDGIGTTAAMWQTEMTVCPAHGLIWDSSSKEGGLTDREWDAFGKYVSIDEAMLVIPEERKKEIEDLVRISDEGGRVDSFPWLSMNEGMWFDKGKRNIFMSDYQWRELQPAWVIPRFMKNPDGTYAISESGTPIPLGGNREVDEEEFELERVRYQGAFGGAELFAKGPEDGAKSWRYYRARMIGHKVVQTQEIPERMFTRYYMTGQPYKQYEKTEWVALVDLMKEGQRFKNSLVSLLISMLQRSPKGGYLYEADTFVNEAEAKKQLSAPYPIVGIKRGKMAGIKDIAVAPFPRGLETYMNMADNAVWRPTGLNPTMLGQIADVRRVSGKVMESISKNVGETMGTYMDALSQYRKRSAAFRLRQYALNLTPEDIIQISPSKAQFIPPPEEWEASLERDVIITEKPASVSEQQEMMGQFMNSGLPLEMYKMGDMGADDILELLPSGMITEEKRQELVQKIQARQQQAIQEAQVQQPQPEEIPPVQ